MAARAAPRDSALRWEVPGGHVALVATCVHEWAQRRQRRIIAFFSATPAREVGVRPRENEADIVSVAWVRPADIVRYETSPFLRPLLGAGVSLGSPGSGVVHFRAEHRALPRGRTGPVIIE